MRTTLDLPDSLLRELKSRAARNGQSLKSLLYEMLQRAMSTPATDTPGAVAANPPVLKRLQHLQAHSGPQLTQSSLPAQSNAGYPELQEDLEKLRRIGFIQ